METSNGKQLEQLLNELGQRSIEELNPNQIKFMDLIQSDPLDKKSLDSLCQEQNIVENTSIELGSIQSLIGGDWDQYAKSIIGEGAQTEIPKSSAGANKIASFATTFYYDVKFVEDEHEIFFELRKPKEPIPPEVGLFIQSIHEAQDAVVELYSSNHQRTTILRKLAGIATVGGASSFTELARQQLLQFKNEIVIQKGGEIKLNYLKNLGIAGISLAFLCSILLMLPYVLGVSYQYENIFQNGVLLIIGSCIGTWLSFAIRKKEIKFEELRLFNGKVSNPFMRLMVLVLIALSFYFMFITNFLNISIGESFSTGTVGEEGYESLAFLIGIFIGLAENSIGPTLTNRIESFTSKLLKYSEINSGQLLKNE